MLPEIAGTIVGAIIGILIIVGAIILLHSAFDITILIIGIAIIVPFTIIALMR